MGIAVESCWSGTALQCCFMQQHWVADNLSDDVVLWGSRASMSCDCCLCSKEGMCSVTSSVWHCRAQLVKLVTLRWSDKPTAGIVCPQSWQKLMGLMSAGFGCSGRLSNTA